MQDHSGTVESRLKALYGKRPQVIKPGLARIRAALCHLEPDLLRIPTVLVGGTNGKGSTSGYLWELLTRAGLRAGLYTSPHLWRFAERIQVSSQKITETTLVSHLVEVEAALPPDVLESLSFFELTTLLAFRVFYRAKVDMMILEVGMGGRFDATNVADPVLSIITSIGLDHQQFLGNSTGAIAGEKAGIMRAGRPVLWGGPEAGDEASQRVIESAAQETGALLLSEGEHFGWQKGFLFLAMPGTPPCTVAALPREVDDAPPFLQSNFAKAVAAYTYLKSCGLVNADLGMLLTHWDSQKVRVAPSRLGRFQRVTGSPPGELPRPLIIDVGHNPAGAVALVSGLKACGLLSGESRPGLVSILADKDIGGILDILRPVLSPLFLFASSSDRTFTRDMLASQHADLPFYPDFTGAWRALQDVSVPGPWVITGSVYAVGEVFQILGIDPLGDTAQSWWE